ncbi:MAG: phosphoglycerate dehydrogenase [Alphaproteobacteria bacterium]|nr:phosphoglycerate dehydrogenase [Alphaproteobacteria bacterium]MBF0332055.1 phosphoglycerate dehydrogenase [Alphaproteobacteria bacterium]
MPLIKVTSPSFSKNATLRDELLSRFPNAVLNDAGQALAGDALAAFLDGADGAVIGLETVDDALLARMPSLRIVAKYGVGLDSIDQEACARRGVRIGWTGGVNRVSAAEMAMGFMLGLNRNLFATAFQMRDGVWNKNGGRQLSGRTVGIIGTGHIGKEVARMLAPFGCRVLGNDLLDMAAWYAANGVEPASKERIWDEAEVITLHVPCTPSTRAMINAETLRRMRPDAVLVNTCRGEVVDQAALKRALVEGWIAGAATDVYESEPPTDMEFLRLPNLVCTPHIGGNAVEAVLAMGRSAITHLESHFLK